MLSIENPPEPSCLCKASVVLKSDERASDKLEADPIGLGEVQSPHFSIRDYALTTRSKDIKKSWPFPQQFLQLCLKHGVRDILPPFEPPDLLRSRCYRKGVESKKLVEFSKAEQHSFEVDSLEIKDDGSLDREPDSNSIRYKSHLPSGKLVVDSSDQAQYPLLEERKLTVDQSGILDKELSSGEDEIVSTVTTHSQIETISHQISELPCSVPETKRVSEVSVELKVPKPPLSERLETSHEQSEKKCRLILKLGNISESGRAEDVVSNCSTVSDPMASKVCPVCKTFASTSNTTLNAHIDQCLSEESDTKRVVSEFSKHKVKPRKKRLMVDIYTTALHCTLKDLDRRNGTNWAIDLALMPPTNEVCTEIKRPRYSPVHTIDDGDEGAVYVDSNGTKLRILSKLNDVPAVTTKEDANPRKHAKDIKASKSLSMSTKKCFSPKYSKYMKVKPQCKKLSSFKLFKGEIQATAEGDYHVDTDQEEEESLPQISNARDQAQSTGGATLRQWVCSKRSGLSRKLNNKNSNRSSGNLVVFTRNPLAESNQPGSRKPSVVRSHILKFSRSSDDLDSSPKTKKVDLLSKTVNTMDSEEEMSPKPPGFNVRWSSENTLAKDHTPKISRPLGKFTSPRSKREDVHMDTIQKSDNFPDTIVRSSEAAHLSLNGKKSSILKKNALLGKPSSWESNKGNGSETTKKFRKHRSFISGTGKRGGELSIDDSGRLLGSTRDFGLDSTGTKKASITHESNLSENVTMSGTGESLSRCNIPGFEQGTKEMSTVENQKCILLETVQLGAECHDLEMETVDMQAEALACVDTNTRPSTEKAVGDPVSRETAISKDLAPASNAKLDPCSSFEEQVKSICASEAQVEATVKRLSNGQKMQCSDETHNGIFISNTQMAGGLESRMDEDSTVQYTECHTDIASVQRSSACLTSHGDLGLEIPQENSSVTSIRIASNQDHCFASDREGSPVSTASTISPPSPEDPKLKDSEAEPFVRPTAVQEKLNSSLANNRGAEKTSPVRRNLEVNLIELAKEPEKLSDEQSCCCSRRENLSKEFYLLRQSIIAAKMPPSYGKEMNSSFYNMPSFSPSFGTYPNVRTDEMAIPILESPTDSTSTKASSDSAGKFQTCSDFGSASPSSRARTQSTSHHLRLMGKDLMVESKEEEPVCLQNVLPSASNNLSNAKYLSLLGFSSANSISNQDNFSYHHHLPHASSMFGQVPLKGNPQMPLQSQGMLIGLYGGPPLQTGSETKADQRTHQKKLQYKPNSQLECTMERIASAHQQRQIPVSSSRAPNPMREVIVVDDSSEVEAEPICSLASPACGLPPTIPGPNLMPLMPFACFPSQNQFMSREFSNGPQPSFPISCPRANSKPVKRGSASEGLRPLLRSPFLLPAPSTGHLNPSLYYSPTLR